MNRILDRVNGPQDLKKLLRVELIQLCGEIRDQLIKRMSVTGGHVGSNLAMIEAETALHTVFDSPRDQIVFDVSHQCYTHKLLTGRKAAYTNEEQYDSISGFTKPQESEHDLFAIGHSSTAISLACGLAKSNELLNVENHIIAVVGDGALSGGEAFEGLNNAAVLKSNFIILINDNNMSIAENHGGIYKNLKQLRETGGKAKCNFFRALGFDYLYIKDGNDFNEIMDALLEAKRKKGPIVIHMSTVKGKGYRFAEEDPENWHYMGPFEIESGIGKESSSLEETYESLTARILCDKMEADPSVSVITAGTPKVVGFDAKKREMFPNQFIDVGIAEEHAVAMASGMAKNGGKPVFGVSSSFLQRTFDQLSSDLALNRSPAVILVFFAGISKGSQTHMGIFDIALTMGLPNMIYLAPTCREEYIAMLKWGLDQVYYPVMIRVPGIKTSSRQVELLQDYSFPPRAEIVKDGEKAAILALGDLFPLGEWVCEILASSYGIQAALINPRYINVLDEDTLAYLRDKRFGVVVTLENGVKDGGFGAQVSSFYSTSCVRVLNYGASKEFVDQTSVEQQYLCNRLTADQIAADIVENF